LEHVLNRLFPLLKEAVFGIVPSEPMPHPLEDDVLASLFQLAKRHDLAHLVGYALREKTLLPAESAAAKDFEKAEWNAVCRVERLLYEYERVCDTLEKSGIDYIPLKGSVLRAFYPENWMRTSCDIDIFLRKESVDSAADCLTNALSYTKGSRTACHLCMISPGGPHIELHFNLAPEAMLPKAAGLLRRVWEHASKADGSSHRYVLSDGYFYFYHIAHMAKHMNTGGCGIRPFLDLFLLDTRVPGDKALRDALLKESGLFDFAKEASRLAEVWFSDAPHTDVSRWLESYILTGGVYGTQDNQISFQQTKAGSRFAYAKQRLFLDRQSLSVLYPILNRYPILLPVCQVRRWGRRLKSGAVKRSMRELKRKQPLSEQEYASYMLKQMNLID